MNRDELEGQSKQVKGKLKKAAADLSGNERLHGEGEADEVVGEAQETAGRVRRKVGEAIEDFGEDLKR